MSRRVALLLFALAAAPLLMLLVLELIALVLMIGVLSDPLDCVADAPAATLAVAWLAFGPLTAAAATAFAGLRSGGPPAGSRRAAAIGASVLAAGLAIALIAEDKEACAAADTGFGENGLPVPLSGFGPIAVILVALLLGAICVATLLEDGGAAE